MKRSDDIAEVTGRHGGFFCFRHDAYVGRSLIDYGEWSEIELQRLCQLAKPGATVVEVGANIGAHSVPLARRVGPGGRVIAFEPQQRAFELLSANLERNGLENVVALSHAVGASEGVTQMPEPDYSSLGNFGSVAAGEGTLQVPLVALDDVVDASRVHLLKLDMEGMEREALIGAEMLIRRDRPVIYLENDRVEQSPALIRTIHDLGYRAFWHMAPLFNPDNWRGATENAFGPMLSVNMLCVPAERNVDFTNAIDDPEAHPSRATQAETHRAD